MRTPTIILLIILLGLSACTNDNVSKSDIDGLIQNQIKSCEDILSNMNAFTDKHGRDGFEIQYEVSKHLTDIHKRTSEFMDSLDIINKNDLQNVVNNFISKTWGKYSLQYPIEISISKDSPISLLKLQIATLENTYLREWQNLGTFRLNRYSAFIIPDKITYKSNEIITGDIGLMAYSDEMKLNIKINGQEIECKNGIGHFSVDPSSLTKGQNFLKADIIFPDTVYTKTIELKRE